MTDAQHLIDLAKKQYNDLANGLEKHFEDVAGQLKDWLPQQIRPSPPPPPRRLLHVPVTYWQNVQRWISQNTALSAGAAVFVGTGAVLLFVQRRAHFKKRRARRSSGGARTEVVVISGSLSSPITIALALDLERRGFIVYVITSSAEDEQHVRNQSRVDLLPLNLDLIYPPTAQEQINRFRNFLSRHHHAFNGAPAHALVLTGIIMVPDTSAGIEPVSTITAETWSTALNAKVLGTILTAQLLIPLATEFNSRLLVLTPSIVPSLRPPQHAVQCTVTGALEAFTATVAAELEQLSVPVCHFKLGNIELPNSRHRKNDARMIKGTPIRHLHDSVFDALHAKSLSRTWHVGRGSLTYDILGRWMPSSLVSRMMGFHNAAAPIVDVASTQEAEYEQTARSIEWEKVEQSP